MTSHLDLKPRCRRTVRACCAVACLALLSLLGMPRAVGGPEGEAAKVDVARGSDESVAAWVKRLREAYGASSESSVRGQILSAWAAEGGTAAVGAVLGAFDAEEDRDVRNHLNELLVQIGTQDVAEHMGKHLRTAEDPRQEDALTVIYGSLKRPEADVPEQPFCDAIREFFKLGCVERTAEVIRRVDDLERSGTRALGQLLYVGDFTCDDMSTHVLCCKAFERRRDDWRAAEVLFDTFPKRIPEHDRLAGDPLHLLNRACAMIRIGVCCVPGLLKLLGNRTFGGLASRTLRDIYNLQYDSKPENLPGTAAEWRTWWKQHKDLQEWVEQQRSDRSF